MNRDSVELYLASKVALWSLEKGASGKDVPKSVELLKGTSANLFADLSDEDQNILSFINLSVGANTCDLMRSYDIAKGEMPIVAEDAVIRKALELQGCSEEEFEKGTLNIANLTPVRRQVTTRDGRTYIKTVWKKKEEVDRSTPKGRAFLQQREAENTVAVGDKVDVKLKGWSSGKKYKAKGLEVAEIHDDYIIAKFTAPQKPKAAERGGVDSSYEYGPNDSHEEGRQVKIPRTDNAAWNKDVSFAVAKVRDTAPKPVTDISQISVGDKVLTKIGSNMEEVEIKYIHPGGDFVKVRTADGRDLRRSHTRLSKPGTGGKKKGMDDEIADDLEAGGVDLSGTTPSNIAAFNTHMGEMSLTEWVEDTRKGISESLGARAASNAKIRIVLTNSGFKVSVDCRTPYLEMRRNFNYQKMSVYHALFKVDADKQGTGVGKKMLSALYKQYKAAGLKKIDVSANIDVGGYAWARYGFTAPKNQAESMLRNFRTGNTSPKVPGKTITSRQQAKATEIFRDFYRNNPDSKRFPMNLFASIGSNNPSKGGVAGKIAMLGRSWDGSIDLRDTEQRTYFENYLGFSR